MPANGRWDLIWHLKVKHTLTAGFLVLLVRWLRSIWLTTAALQLRLFLLTATDTKAEFGSRKSSSSSS